MARDSDNAQALNDSFVYVAPKGTILPTIPTAAPGAGLDPAFADLGWLTDTGIGETPSNNTNQRRAINGTVIKTIKTADDTSFTFECYERNAVVMGLMRPGSAATTAGDTAEVQTLTLVGTPTAGTFKVIVSGAGQTAALPWNVSAAALAAALTALVGYTVTVTLASNVYTVTFAQPEGNVPQMQVDYSALIPNTASVAVATSTPGVSGITTTQVKSHLGADERCFVLKEDFGVFQRLAIVPRGEAFVTGSMTDKPGDLAVVQFRIDCYPDSSATKYIDITNNPAEAVS